MPTGEPASGSASALPSMPPGKPVSGRAPAVGPGAGRTGPLSPPLTFSAGGTTPFWNDGSAQRLAGPPPAAPSSPWNTHTFLPLTFSSGEHPVDQPVSKSRVFDLLMPSVVPPTPMAQGSADGSSTPEPSPDEKYMPTPSSAACTR